MSLRLMSAVISTSVPRQTYIQNSEKLLRQLLECVQECQKRYGGKTELATEFDSCIIALCLTLEQVFLHGTKVQNKESTFKQVSDIVANSLNIGGESPSFWPFVKRHLTKHEQERYSGLKHIWTDTGKGRAWIRSALNERSLERYFHILLSNCDILKVHYEDWALLRDQEKSSMLPNMAAGVASILFALSIDKPELNSGSPPRIESLRSRAEPVIEAPIPGKRHSKEKRKRKVARQFISFDKDDSMLSTSIPSSSSSTSSDSMSTSEAQHVRNNSRSSLDQITENQNSRRVDASRPGENQPDKTVVNRQLSIETSGSRSKFSSETVETLTPVSQTEIGELTPVFVEVNANFESPNVSDDTLEIPADISAVLTAIETKNEEELNKKQSEIQCLVRENESLKDQVKKYISAIQMLRRDDISLPSDLGLDSLQIEQLPDYKGEAQLYERKLVQVAEMHAELIDFNTKLQQALSKKDAVIDRFKSELEELRGPMSTDNMLTSEGNKGSVNVWIPSAFLTGSGSSSHHVYQIFLRAGSDEWNIYRRYAQFHALHSDLKKLDPAISTFDFPPKKSIGKKDSSLVEDRRKRLQVYLRKIIAHWPELAHCNNRFLLEQHLSFFKTQNETDKNKSIFSPRRNQNPTENHYTGL